MSADRVTANECADAHDRFIALVDQAAGTVRDAMELLRERKEDTSNARSGPLFPFHGEAHGNALSDILIRLRNVHVAAAANAYDFHQASVPLVKP